MDWTIKITKTQNGYLLLIPEEEVTRDFVFEIMDGQDETHEEQKTFVKLLHFMKDHFSMHYNKHNKTNIEISINEE